MSAESQLPRPADGSQPGMGAAPTGKAPSRTELQAEIERTRAELGATVDALSTQLSPAYQARRASKVARTAAADAGAFLTGGGLPDDDGRRARNVKVLLGSVGALAAVVVLKVVVGRAAGHRAHN